MECAMPGILHIYIVNRCEVQTWILKIRLGEDRADGKQPVSEAKKRRKEQKERERERQKDRKREKESAESIKRKGQEQRGDEVARKWK